MGGLTGIRAMPCNRSDPSEMTARVNQLPPLEPAGLLRAVGPWSMVAVGINGIIGAGIFGLPSKAFAAAGVWSLLGMAVVVVAAMLIGLAFAEVSSRYSSTGGPYLYTLDTFGPLAGFQVGWLRWLSGLMAWAANAILLTDYLSYGGAGIDGGWPRAAVLAGVTAVFTGVHYVGVRRAALVSNLMTLGKLAPMAVFIGVGLFHLNPAPFQAPPALEFDAVAASAILMMYAFAGFESLPIMAGEVGNPTRTMPVALLGALGVVTVFYLLIMVVCIGTLPGLGESARPVADAAQGFLGGWGGWLMAVGAVISIAGNLGGQVFGTSRTLYAMAEQGQIPGYFGRVHERFRTPHVAIVVTMAATLALALSGTFVGLLVLSTMTRIMLYAATCAALPVLRRREGGSRARFHLPGGRWIAGAGLVLSLGLISRNSFRDLWLLAGALVAGWLIYRVSLRLKGSGTIAERPSHARS